MILQKLQLFDDNVHNKELQNLYYRSGTGTTNNSNSRIAFDKNGELIFNTYYNSFSFNKWSKYTKIKDLHIALKLKGIFEITVIKLWLVNGEAVEERCNVSLVKSYNSIMPRKVKIDIPFAESFNGSYGFIIRSLESGGELYSGYYGSDISETELNEIDLALGICHYKREEFVVNNLCRLIENVYNDESSFLRNHLHIFVADNSRSLKKKINELNGSEGYERSSQIIGNEKITILENKNIGGAGGFSRTMLEAQTQNRFTHMILMDDDVVFTHYALERLYSFLRVFKSELLDRTIIGGAMLRLDEPYIQYGNGETWSVNGMIFNKTNYNLYVVRDILRNEQEEDINQLPWWFFCYPLNEKTIGSYSLPLFFQYDDIDFNQRYRDFNKVTLNGVSLLHENFEKKYSLTKEYYAIRNRLIICSVHGDQDFTKQFIKGLLTDIIKMNVMTYRYKLADLAIRAVKDYFRGFDWLAKCDCDALNKKLSDSVYTISAADESEIPYLERQYNESLCFAEGSKKRLLRRLLLNGAFIPSKRTAVIPMIHYKVIKAKLFRVKTAVNYNPENKTKFVTVRNNLLAVKTMLSYLLTIVLINCKFDKTVRDYKEKYKYYISKEFWKEYMEL